MFHILKETSPRASELPHARLLAFLGCLLSYHLGSPPHPENLFTFSGSDYSFLV